MLFEFTFFLTAFFLWKSSFFDTNFRFTFFYRFFIKNGLLKIRGLVRKALPKSIQIACLDSYHGFGSFWGPFKFHRVSFGRFAAHFGLPVALFGLTLRIFGFTLVPLCITFARPGGGFSHFWGLLLIFFISFGILDEYLIFFCAFQRAEPLQGITCSFF